MPDTPKGHNRGAGFPAREVVLFDPPASAWASMVRAQGADATTRTTRHTLGLSTDRPVVMGGHQPGFWHPGILAKWFAVEACAQHIKADPAWVVVDQSPGAGTTIQYPAVRTKPPTEPAAHAGDGTRLVRNEIIFGKADIPPASQLSARVEPPDNAALQHVAKGLAQLARLFEAHAREPTLAHQLHAACVEAIEPLAHAKDSMRSFFATGLHATPAFAELVGAMREDPAACVRLYNEAAAEHPEAGVRTLAVRDGAIELPLWERLGSPAAPAPWRTVTSDRLPDLPDERLVLRGLPMTGLLRRWACDLFVHGTGGGASHAEAGYDRITERWFAAWLGVRDLAPAVVASATLRLDFAELPSTRDIPAPAEIARARQRAHQAAHDPSLLGEADLGARKRELARQIAALPRGSTERAALFAQMHSLRAEAACAHADTLEELRAHAEALAGRAAEAEILAGRAWSFLFHAPEALRQLRKRIERAFA